MNWPIRREVMMTLIEVGLTHLYSIVDPNIGYHFFSLSKSKTNLRFGCVLCKHAMVFLHIKIKTTDRKWLNQKVAASFMGP